VSQLNTIESVQGVLGSRKTAGSSISTKGSDLKINNIRMNSGEDYPDWRKFQSLMTDKVIGICEEVQANGHRVFMLDANVANHLPIICPSYPQPYPVWSTDKNGDMHHDMTVTVTKSRLAIEYAEGTNLHARPGGYHMFMNGNPNFESNYPGLEKETGIEPATLQKVAPDMLSRGDIVIFFYIGNDGEVFGTFMAPKACAHFLQQFDHMHLLPSYEELEELVDADAKTNTQFLCVPGLRRSFFNDNQNVTFFPSDDGTEMLIIGSSVYEGAVAKKPQFVTISWFLMQKFGLALHASMVQCLITMMTFVMICDSGRGKTELRKSILDFCDSAGRLLLGFRKKGDGEELKRLSIPWNKDWCSSWLSLGDDGLSVLNVFKALASGFFKAINWENGLFDRNSGAYQKGDLAELDYMIEINENWVNIRTTNLAVTPGQRKFRHWIRTQIFGKPCSNPRLSYSNEMLALALKKLAKEEGHNEVKVAREEREVSQVFYAYAPVKTVNCGGPIQGIGNGMATIYEILGGPDAVRNKSKSDARPTSERGIVSAAVVRFASNGTMGQFNMAHLRVQFNRVVARHVNSPNVNHSLIFMEEKPNSNEWTKSLTTAEKEVEYVPEVFLRELISMEARGIAKTSWRPSKFFFLGNELTEILLGNNGSRQSVTPEWFDADEIHGRDRLDYARRYYKEMCDQMDELEEGGVCDDVKALFDFFRNVYGKDRMVIEHSEQESAEINEKLDELLYSLKVEPLKPVALSA